MEEQPNAGGIRLDAKQLEARRRELRAMRDQTHDRSRELIEASTRARRRRAELRAERELVRAHLTLSQSCLPSADRRAAAAILEAALQVTGLAANELWLDYFALGGDASVHRVEEMLAGDAPLSRGDHDRLALALNERLSQSGWVRPLAYWDGSR